MRSALALLLLLAGAHAADEVTAPREVPLLNVEVVDREGVRTRLAGFHRVSAEDRFRGFLGEARIEVPYDRVREMRVEAPRHPGGRMRARLALRSGKEIAAQFDEREGEQLFIGFAPFGRMEIFFRDIRRLTFLGETARKDLPEYGRPGHGVDAKLRDRQGVVTELVRFRRANGTNAVPGVLGAARIAVPMRLVSRLELTPASDGTHLDATATLRKGKAQVAFKVPVYEEETVFRGDATFGVFYIRLGKVRELVVHRVSPPLRGLDPLAAARAPAPKKEGPPEQQPPR